MNAGRFSAATPKANSCYHLLVLLLAVAGVQAQTIDFESTVPTNWNATLGTLGISPDHYRIGSASLQWDWSAGDTLVVTAPNINPSRILNSSYNTMTAFVYNETPLSGPLKIEFLDGSGKINYHFDFVLNYQGWRRVTRSYKYDMYAISNSTTAINKVVIRAPATGSGTVFFDDWEFVGSSVTRKASRQMPDVAGTDSNREHIDADVLVPNIAYQTATAGDLADLNTIRNYMRDWFAGGTTGLSAATNYYNSLNIVVRGNSIKGNTTSPAAADAYMLALARGYINTGNTNLYAMAKNLLWHINDLGYAGGGGFHLWLV